MKDHALDPMRYLLEAFVKDGAAMKSSHKHELIPVPELRHRIEIKTKSPKEEKTIETDTITSYTGGYETNDHHFMAFYCPECKTLEFKETDEEGNRL